MLNKQKTILAVDDDLDILRVVDKILKAAGFNVICVQSPEAAREYLASDIPHLIISDLNMEPEDGYSFIQSIRSKPALNEIPILVLSTVNEYNSVKRAIGLGINDYAVKPIVASLLIRKIKKALLNKEFSTWTALPHEQIEINVVIDAKISAIGEAGYTLVGPFKIATSEEVKVSSKALTALKLDQLKHQVSPYVKNSISAGNFANDLTFIGVGESESAKIRLFIRNGLLP